MRIRQAIDGSRARTVLLTGVLLCLCFSAGEGLRLMPIPSPVTDEVARPNFRSVSDSLGLSSLYQYATCGPEGKGLKRVQRQTVRGGLLASLSGGQSLTLELQLTPEIDSASYHSPFCVLRPAGRAPPSA